MRQEEIYVLTSSFAITSHAMIVDRTTAYRLTTSCPVLNLGKQSHGTSKYFVANATGLKVQTGISDLNGTTNEFI